MYFFGWNNFKKNFVEFKKMYSGEKSFFSKKRIESGIAFIILQWGMVYYLIHNIALEKMDMYDMLMWAGIEGVVAGYMISHIQNEKNPKEPDIPSND